MHSQKETCVHALKRAHGGTNQWNCQFDFPGDVNYPFLSLALAPAILQPSKLFHGSIVGTSLRAPGCHPNVKFFTVFRDAHAARRVAHLGDRVWARAWRLRKAKKQQTALHSKAKQICWHILKLILTATYTLGHFMRAD